MGECVCVYIYNHIPSRINLSFLFKKLTKLKREQEDITE